MLSFKYSYIRNLLNLIALAASLITYSIICRNVQNYVQMFNVVCTKGGIARITLTVCQCAAE